ncbi:type 8 capsular polysaccharide synthesis protein Cap8I [Staphylococcus aureus]|uniref:type 8 capsular polysaccharide synthesis protein Cap8I n=1 Tax=Staphylococcus aureus TaxID=1280 RepID=UPI000D1B0726|nr:type 8 capsular polysaccharide synthesis protein Cap8I [Staphylococcus aureus]
MNKIYNVTSYVIAILMFPCLMLGDKPLLFLAPISYGVGKLFISFSNNPNFKFSKIVYDVLGFLRLVFIPAMIVFFQDSTIDNLPLGQAYFNQAVIYMSVEFIIGSLFILILSKLFKHEVVSRNSFTLSGSSIYYIVFGLVICGIFVAFPEVRKNISFLIIKTDAMGRGTEATSGLNVLFVMLFQLALALLFLIIAYASYKKYKENPKIIYVVLPLAIEILNISLIVGERRSYQLYTMVAVLTVVSILFSKHKRRINIIIISVGIFVLALMTLYKELYVFNYSSYSEALNSTSVSNLKIVDTLQSYFYGPSNIAASIDYLNYYNGSFKQYLFDNTRAVFGFNFFLDKKQLITSQLFNQLIYGSKQLTGHLISSAGYGIIYFGPLFFYLNLIANIFFAFLSEYIIRKSHSLEVIFIGTYIYMRLITSIFSHPTPLITLISMILVVYVIAIIPGIIIKKFTKKVGIE